jgi:DNA-directed RNA polymerase III subunit RPC6
MPLPAEPALASEPRPDDVNPLEEAGPDSATPTIQPRPGIITNLPAGQRTVYEAIFAAGSKGMLLTEVRKQTGLSANTARKHANALKNIDLVKQICDVRNRNKKIFVASDFEPASEITGGAWYNDGHLDTDAIAAARSRCLAQVKKHGAATATMIHEGIQTDDPRAGYDEAKVREILGTMVLERELEEFSNAGSDKQTWYRVAEKDPGGAMEAIPCGVCPRIGECSPEAIVSPSTCVYYRD